MSDLKDLAAALAKAQGEIKAALKDSKNPHFKSSYADLTSVWDACRPSLSANGLSVVQSTNFDGNDMWLETILLHSSGQSITGRYPIRPQQQTPQGYGSALTYARRYALASMVGVVADEDDDGNAASSRASNSAREPEQKVETKRDPKPAPTLNKPADPKDAAEDWYASALKQIRAMKTMKDLDEWLAMNAKKSAYLMKVNVDLSNKLQDAIATKVDVLRNILAAV